MTAPAAGGNGPDPQAVDLLERVVDTPIPEHLPPDVEAEVLRWVRVALVRATTERGDLADMLGLCGTHGRGDGFGEARRRIRDRRLAAAGELLAPEDSAAAQARAVLEAMTRLADVPLLEVTVDDLPVARLIRQAQAFPPIPTNEHGLAQAIRRGRRTRNSPLR